MALYDYQPRRGGAAYDPVDAGGRVDSMTLFGGPDRQGMPVGVAAAPTRPRPGVYRYDVPDSLPAGRYWCTVTYVPSAGAPSSTDGSVRLDLPLGTGMVTSPEDVGRQLGLSLPLSPEQREDLLDAISAAQGVVSGHIGRPLSPTLVQLRGVAPAAGADLGDWRAWRADAPDDDFAVDAYTPDADGTFDVTLRVGLDGAAEEPIRQYVAAHATEALRASGRYGGRRVSSVSAEGQSVSYESAPAAGSAGSLPELSSLDRYRLAAVFSRRRPAFAPWPYGPSYPNRWW